MDTDLNDLDRETLIQEVIKLRNGIRKHRDTSGHELCWYHPELWGLLPEKLTPDIVVPEWSVFLEGCVCFRKSLEEQAPDAPRTNDKFDLEKYKNG